MIGSPAVIIFGGPRADQGRCVLVRLPRPLGIAQQQNGRVMATPSGNHVHWHAGTE
jgi:hypothetical protein